MATEAASIVSASLWFKLGSLSGATSVAAGAFGSHTLMKNVHPKLVKSWETAANYQLIHSVALLAMPLARRPMLAGSLMTTGMLLFSGSLYTLVLTHHKKLDAITTVCGAIMIAGLLATIAGWLALLL